MAHELQKLLQPLRAAANVVKKAEALVITAGAGMGVDSGLPDFRGQEGFWRAYPPLKRLGLRLESMSTPQWFHDDPEFAWGFFGHRYNLYQRTEPHRGFHILKKWVEKMKHGYFIFTSNVDGQFQKAGFNDDNIVEYHGSIHFMQCVNTESSHEIWPVPKGTEFNVDMSTLRAAKPLPMGPPGKNTDIARPNILMFNDWEWESSRTDEQHAKYKKFLDSLTDLMSSVAVVEIGAGLAVPTVRDTSESLITKYYGKCTLIRINPNEPVVPEGHISLPMKGLEALEKIDQLLVLK